MRVSRCIATVIVLILWPGIAGAQTADDLFEANTIRDVRLTMSERDWATLRENYLANTYYACDVRIMLSGQDAVVRNAGVRSRGSGSRSGAKPALKIDISRYVSGQRFLGLRSIILRNLWQDPSMVHEHAALELQRRMGLPVPRTVFARVFVNEVYSGLYEVIEDVDEELLDRVRGEHAGYLFEFNWLFPYSFQYLGPDLEPYAALWSPKTRDREAPSVLYGPFEQLSRIAERSGPRDFVASVGGSVDLVQMLRLVAADNFMADWDGFVGAFGVDNIYWYRPLNGPAIIVPWDKDNTFHALDYNVFEGTQHNVLVARALADPALRAIYVEALREAAAVSQAGGGWLERFIESTVRVIRKSARLDLLKPYTNGEFEAAVLEARRFARLRASMVEAQLALANALVPMVPMGGDSVRTPKGLHRRRRRRPYGPRWRESALERCRHRPDGVGGVGAGARALQSPRRWSEPMDASKGTRAH